MDSIEYYDEFTLLAISNKKDESGEYIFDGDALELELIGFNENDGKIEIMIFYKFFYDRKTKKATTEEVMTKYNLQKLSLKNNTDHNYFGKL